MNSFHACFSPNLALTIVYQWPCQHSRALLRLLPTPERVPGYGRQTGRGPLKITPSAGGDLSPFLWSRGWHLFHECPLFTPLASHLAGASIHDPRWLFYSVRPTPREVMGDRRVRPTRNSRNASAGLPGGWRLFLLLEIGGGPCPAAGYRFQARVTHGRQ